ncbi:MAG: hypothetical protein F6K25_22460 [Okeania sp. SIO2G4]|uniref:hypothetical protein n=1 Tax=unclassified Okeania TaxID=2634635 RepID=UPI0013BB1559|nr:MULTISPECIES: hypothetical protein [unclassified Okeania]NEP05354.1 hypothetical protein [Okeania sp. SIO4D6]NEP76061.1 hypothetical protein [Okeania sp. SIO2G5]NEP97089.1 hypothetical protein [Okeania sp. SIO2F5]NEQ93278.1 hypothetical protein [Okeania sp. SIO2G4]
MPEAELPGNQNLPETNNPVSNQKLGHDDHVDQIKPALESEIHTSVPEDDEWETVNFPGVISVDSIPVVGTASAEAKNLVPTNQNQPQKKSQEISEIKVRPTKDSIEYLESTNLMEALHDCNRELVNRVTDLETALEECQETLENQEKLLEERTKELAATQQQVTRLFYKLELCNQIIQRQEVLVESLTDKWDVSQQQQAQMERECALTKQSYSQQIYHLKELENSCKELRARLYRQQQQTLQFKAALERCLEMPGRIDTMDIPTEISTEESPVIASQVNSLSEPQKQEHLFVNFNTKKPPSLNSEPVKPWSPQQKNQQQQEALFSKKEKNIAKISLDKKIDLPQALAEPEKVELSEQNIYQNELPQEVSTSQLNPSLPSFSRIGEDPNYELIDEKSPTMALEEIESEEYVVMEENYLDEYRNSSQEVEKLAENNIIVEESLEGDTSEDEAITTIKSERISWNIATGKWNVSEYQEDPEKDIDPEGFFEVSEDVQRSKLDLPTWEPLVFEPEVIEEDVVSEVPQKQHLSLGAIDLPSFPRIPIDDQPSAVNG